MFLNYCELVIMVLLGLLFLGVDHPMGMVLVMMFITVFYSLFVYTVMGSYWYGFVLMLVMLSGVLVVFTYMVSMIPNEKFNLSGYVVILFYLCSLFLYYNKMLLDVSLSCLQVWSGWSMVLMLYMVMFLLVIMLMVVWVSNWWRGPVRV